jgi:hypothetical protein
LELNETSASGLCWLCYFIVWKYNHHKEKQVLLDASEEVGSKCREN